MIIINKNEGTKIPYEVSGTKICFDDNLTVNLTKREEDWPVSIDICFDADRELVIGAAAGRSYVAQIDIPAREYEEVDAEASAGAVQAEDESGQGTTNPNGETAQTSREPLPLDMDKVTLTLWSIE